MLAHSLLRARAGRPDYGYLGYAAACGVLAVAFHSITDFNLAIPSNALTLAVLIGVLACWRRPPVPVLAQREESAGGSARRAMPPAALMVAGALIAMAPVCADALDAGDAPRISLLIDGDNAARVFSASNATSKAALDDLQALVRATPDGPFSEATVRYIERRMEDAIALQSAGLRHLPTSFNAHIAMGHLRVGRCAADALRERPDTNCLADGMPQFRAALQLNPMSATTHAKVARLLITAWPLLGETERAEAARIIQRAKEMHPDDQGLFDEALAMLGPGGTP
jgi:hypothetical protein